MPDLLNAEGAVAISAEPPRLRLLAAGDLCPIGRLEEMLGSDHAADAFGDGLPLFERADLSVVNLESPLTDTLSPIAKCGPNFGVARRVAAGLGEAGIDVACLANNHMMDQGERGLADTVAALDEAGIGHLGAGGTPADASAPLALTVAGLNVTLLNIAEGEFSRSRGGPGAAPLDPVANCRAVAQAAYDADLVLVFLHAGNEQILFPPPWVQRFCRELIDAGAHAVIAHHPHVPQGIELYGNRPIAYSLGNFLFDWPEPEPETDTSFLLELELSAGGVCGLQAHPIRKADNGGASMLADQERADYVGLLNELSAPLSDEARMAELWDEQCVLLHEIRYAEKLRRVAGLLDDGGDDRRKTELLAYNLLCCEAHRETLTHILRLRTDGRLRPVATHRQYLDDLMARLKAMARATPRETNDGE